MYGVNFFLILTKGKVRKDLYEEEISSLKTKILKHSFKAHTEKQTPQKKVWGTWQSTFYDKYITGHKF